MAKTIIIDHLTGSRIPFLRGIMTRSLQDSGMEFEQAYEAASLIREKLGEKKEISSLMLREMVVKHLEKTVQHEVLERYSDLSIPPDLITVVEHDGSSSAFSESDTRRYLEACGLSSTESGAVISSLSDSLLKNGETKLSVDQLGYRIYQLLKKEFGNSHAQNYLVWRNFKESGRPLLLLIGGTTGCGKSTVATEIAHNLDIVRTQSTDMLREVMRIMIPKRLLPVLHQSSFTAWQALPRASTDEGINSETNLMTGYFSQSELLSVSTEAVVNRALHERVSLILEGIHIHPNLLERIPRDADAAVVMVMLGVLKQGQLKKQIRGRGALIPKRRAKRYLKYFDDIWCIQSNLLAEADNCQVPIVINDNKERVLREIMRIIVSSLKKDFDSTPEKVFNL
jgi:2-phosphoglycerate kinase